MKKEKNKQTIFIVGATSGIGYALTEHYLNNGHTVCGFGRNMDKLNPLKEIYPKMLHISQLDIRNIDDIFTTMGKAAKQSGPMDICIVSSSISEKNVKFDWEMENNVIQTNVTGYASVLNWATRYLTERGAGHLVGITSLAKYTGNINPAYCASKAFESIYLEGIRLRLSNTSIHVTEIMPGFVDTPLIGGRDKVLLVVPVKKAARQIVRAIEKKKPTAVISRRWLLIKWIIPLIPFWIKKRII